MTISSLDVTTLSAKSLDHDGHYSAIKNSKECAFNDNDIYDLRMDCIRLVCSVATKFNTIRKTPSNVSCQCKEDVCAGSSCLQKDPFLPSDCTNATSLDGSVTSSRCDESVTSLESNNSDSTFHVEIDETEIDDSDDLYNIDHTSQGNDGVDNIDAANNENDGLFNVDNNCLTDDEDDSSVEEMYSDYRENSVPSRCSNAESVNGGQDDVLRDDVCLICPGDVVEYFSQDLSELPKKNSVETIVDTKLDSYVLLKNGVILRPKVHSIRKIKMYCSDTGNLLPVSTSTWHRLEKCLLQQGSLLDYEDEILLHTDDEDDTVSDQCKERNEHNRRR